MVASRSARILIVDDEPEITSILFDLFEDQHDCTTAGSAEEALAICLEAGKNPKVLRFISLRNFHALHHPVGFH